MPSIESVHLTPCQLRALTEGRLSAADAARLRRHLAECPSCASACPGTDHEGRTAWPTLGDAGTPSALPFDPGEVPAALLNHPRYRLVRRLGAGGMGVVYQAVHTLMERDVALKIINASLTRHPDAVGRFVQEVKAAARLHHPNLVTAHDAEQVGEVHVLVMELVDGISLARFVEKKGPLPIEHACHFVRQAALGLQHAHEQGLVHRDVKPQNLMVTRKGQVKVLDFGLARLARDVTWPGVGPGRLTHFGAVLGTPDYMAPEQVNDSGRADERSDIYSLGCTLYFLLAGHPPFTEGGAMERAVSHVSKFPRPLGAIRPDVPEELLAVVARMMAKSPEARYQTAGEVARDLTLIARTGTTPVPVLEPADAPTLAEPAVAPSRGRARRPARRSRTPTRLRWLLGAGVSLGVVLLVGGGTVLMRRGPLARPALLPEGAARAREARPKVLLVVPRRGFWYSEYEALTQALADQATVVVASSMPGLAHPALWEPMAGPQPPGRAVTVDLIVPEVRVGEYVAIIFLSAGPKNEFVAGPLGRQQAKDLIDAARKEGIWLAALGNGGTVLARAGTLHGKKATSDPGATQFLEDHGAVIEEKPLVADGQVLTASSGDEAGLLVRAILDGTKNRRTDPVK